MRVYHFVKEVYGIQNIERRRLKVATLSDLNDPFELLGYSGRDPIIRRAFQGVKDQLAKKRGLMCFSENWSNPVHWSHYADGHKGLCLGFEVPAKYLMKVEYRPNRLEPNMMVVRSGTPEAEVHMMRSLCTKYSHWAYEQERRMWVDLTGMVKENGFFFLPFSDEMRLEEVIVGHCSKTTRSDLSAALGNMAAEIMSFKARLAFKSFSVTRQKNDRLWK